MDGARDDVGEAVAFRWNSSPFCCTLCGVS